MESRTCQASKISCQTSCGHQCRGMLAWIGCFQIFLQQDVARNISAHHTLI